MPWFYWRLGLINQSIYLSSGRIELRDMRERLGPRSTIAYDVAHLFGGRLSRAAVREVVSL